MFTKDGRGSDLSVGEPYKILICFKSISKYQQYLISNDQTIKRKTS